MSVSTECTSDGELAATEPLNVQYVRPSPEDGAVLVRAFVSIRNPERRRAVLDYIVEQAKIDNLQRV